MTHFEQYKRTTCLALAEDLCKCKVSPNIRGVGFSTEALLPELLGLFILGDNRLLLLFVLVGVTVLP